LTLNNKTLYVYSNIITYSYESKDYQAAIDYSNKALEVFPYQKSILQLRTLAYQAAGKYSEGVEV